MKKTYLVKRLNNYPDPDSTGINIVIEDNNGKDFVANLPYSIVPDFPLSEGAKIIAKVDGNGVIKKVQPLFNYEDMIVKSDFQKVISTQENCTDQILQIINKNLLLLCIKDKIKDVVPVYYVQRDIGIVDCVGDDKFIVKCLNGNVSCKVINDLDEDCLNIDRELLVKNSNIVFDGMLMSDNSLIIQNVTPVQNTESIISDDEFGKEFDMEDDIMSNFKTNDHLDLETLFGLNEIENADILNKNIIKLRGKIQIEKDDDFSNDFYIMIDNTKVLVHPGDHKMYQYCLNEDDEYEVICKKTSAGYVAKHFSCENPLYNNDLSILKRFTDDLVVKPNLDKEFVVSDVDIGKNIGFTANFSNGKKNRAVLVFTSNNILRLYDGYHYILNTGYIAGNHLFVLSCEQNPKYCCYEYEKDERMKGINAVNKEDFIALSVQQQEDVLNYINDNVRSTETESVCAPSYTLNDYTFRFNVIKKNLPVDIQNILENILHDNSLKSHHKKMICDQLLIKSWNKKVSPFVFDEALKKMKDSFFGQLKIKTEILKRLAMQQEQQEKNKRMIIPLVSRKYERIQELVECLSDATGMPASRINLIGEKNSEGLFGSSRVYDNASVGRLIRGIQSKREIICLNGVDAVADENLKDTIYTVVQSGEILDNMLELPFDISKNIIIISFSDMQNIPDWLLSYNPIEFEAYSPTQRSDFCLRECGRYPELAERIDEEIADLIANKFTINKYSLSEIENNIFRIYDAFKTSKDEITTEEVTRALGIDSNLKTKRATTVIELKQKFQILKEQYEPERICQIEEFFEMYNKTKNTKERAEIIGVLDKLVNIISVVDTEKKTDLKAVKDELDKSVYGLESAKRGILRFLTFRNKCSNLLLVGTYGVGKTTLVRTLAKSIEKDVIYISCCGASKQTLTGDGQEFSQIVKQLSESPNSILVLDEIDKISDINSPANTIQDYLDGIIKDEKLPIPISHPIMVVCICNVIGKVPPNLLTRFEVVACEPYEKNEKFQIARDYLIPSIVEELDKSVIFTDDSICQLVEKTTEGGMRKIEQAVKKVVADKLMNSCDKEIIISDQDIDAALGYTYKNTGNINLVQSPGNAIALAVGPTGGEAFNVEVKENLFGEEYVITGLLGESAIDSLKKAKFLVENTLKKQLPKLFLDFSTAVQKDGPSAGLTIFAAIYSFATNKCLAEKSAFTGEIGISGQVFPVGGICEKLKGAIDNGVKTVYIPKENYEELISKKHNLISRISVVPVSNVNDILGNFR